MDPFNDIIAFPTSKQLVDVAETSRDCETLIKVTLQALEPFFPTIEIKREGKDCEEATKSRKLADDLCVKNKGKIGALLDACELYSKSISRAEKSSPELAIAYANRSAVLFNLNKHAACVRDIERALANGYPDQKKDSLIRRRAKSFKILGISEQHDFCEETRKCLDNMSLNEEKGDKLDEEIDNDVPKISIARSCSYWNQESEANGISLEFVSHPKFSAISNAIEVVYSREQGRHLIATRNIEVGEILILEKPFAAILDPSKIFSHCSHCLIRMWDSIPCENCIHVMYCSEKCRSEAWTQYHDIECQITACLMEMNMTSLLPFSLRIAILAVRRSGGIRALKKELAKVETCGDFAGNFLLDEIACQKDECAALSTLHTHERNRNQRELFGISLRTAFALYFMFTLTPFFGNSSKNKAVSDLYNDDDAIFAGTLIAKHQMIIQTNVYTFTELRNNEQVKVGDVLGTMTSLLNHSCHPNVARCSTFRNYEPHQMTYALQPIKKGSTLLNDYGCHFALNSKWEREKYLKEFHFKCCCPACDNSWPLYKDMPTVLLTVAEFREKVEISRAIVRSKKYEKLILEGALEKLNGKKVLILKDLARSISIIFKHTERPSQECHQLLELFRHAFVQVYGNVYTSSPV